MKQSLSPDSEEWSKEQKELWQHLERHWEILIQGKVPEFLEYIHPDFRGFGHESPLMIDKRWLTKWVGFWCENTKFPIHYLSPISCGIFQNGNLAIIQYYLFTIEKSLEHTKRSVRRYTMTWIKENNKWQVIASHNNIVGDTI